MGTAEMDGVDTVTQCPIIPGNQFTYKFPVKDQGRLSCFLAPRLVILRSNAAGTYWYHS